MRASLILCAVVLSAFAQEPPAAPVNCYLEGRVINAANGEPVRNARLILSHADNPEGGAGSRAGFTTTTDDKGRFAMKDVEPGKYQFSASRGGFAESEYGARRPGRPRHYAFTRVRATAYRVGLPPHAARRDCRPHPG